MELRRQEPKLQMSCARALRILVMTFSLVGLVSNHVNLRQYWVKRIDRPRWLTKQASNDAVCMAIDDPDKIDFTLVIQTSEDRLWLLRQYCEEWEGPMSIAVYTNRSAQNITQSLADAGCLRVASETSKNKILVQTLSPDEVKLQMKDFPTNLLRNLAMTGIRTSHAVMWDIDFVPSLDLMDTLRQLPVRKALASDPRKLLVVPAFEYRVEPPTTEEDRAKLLSRIPLTIEELKKKLQRRSNDAFSSSGRSGSSAGGQVTTFAEYYPPGHDSTDYDKWYEQDSGTLEPVPCVRHRSYEPYLVFQYCHDLPPFQPVFTGYGFNKSSWIMHLRYLNYTFAQVGGAFGMHFPHKKSPARRAYLAGRMRQVRKMNGLREEFSRFLQRHHHEDELSTPLCSEPYPVNAVLLFFRNAIMEALTGKE